MNKGIDDDAVSISVGYILNMGLGMVFLALVFFIIAGVTGQGYGSTQQQLEYVGEETMSVMVSVDTLAQRGGDGTASFKPPETGLDSYKVHISGGTSGVITVSSDGESVEMQYKTVTPIQEMTYSSANPEVFLGYKPSMIRLKAIGGG